MFQNMSLQGRGLALVCLVFIASSILSGCGGDSNATGEITVPNAQLTAFEVEGYELDFSPGKRNGYIISIPQDIQSITFTAEAEEGRELSYTKRSIENPTTTILGDTIQSGEAVTVDVDEGDNILSVRVDDPSSTVFSVYTVAVHRVSGSAKVNAVVFQNLFDSSLSDTNYVVPLTPDFESSVFEYEADLNSAACAISARLFTNERNTQAELNGVSIKHAQGRAIEIFEGENVVTATVTSEDGTKTEDYTFTFNRAALSDAEKAVNPRLIDIELSAADLNYVCSTKDYGATVSYDDQEITLTVTPEVEGITMTVGKAVDGQFPEEGDSQPVGEPITLSLDEGVNSYQLITTATDGTTTDQYTLVINRISRNIVNVTTAEELQAALLSAEPRDEIRVFAGTYEGLATEEASGKLGVHFYSAQSGTEENPIRLIGASSGGAILTGVSVGENVVLQLEGDHWFVSGLQVTGAKHGVVLDSVAHTQLNALSVHGVGQNGVVLRNGSSHNFVQNSSFSLTGVLATGDALGTAEAVVIGSTSADWADAPGGGGLYDENDLNNTIRKNTFASTVVSEAIEINEGAQGTLIEHNQINAGGLSGEFDANTSLRIQGNGTIVRFNSFYSNADASLASVVTVEAASQDWHDIDWGVDTKVNDNILDLDGVDLPLVTAGPSNTVWVTNNTRDGELAVTYVGDAINTTDLESPIFEIRTAEVADQCLGYDESNDVQFLRIQSCNDSNEQRWVLERDDEDFIRVQSVAFPELYLRTRAGLDSNCGDQFVYGGAESGAFLQRWLLSFLGNDVYLLNKENTSFAVTAGTTDIKVDDYMVVCPTVFNSMQRFTFVEVE